VVTEELRGALRAALEAVGVDPGGAEIGLERPARPEHGDWSSNAALAFAGPAGRNPRELAHAVAAALAERPPRHVEAVEVAGPGFVNFRLRPTWLHDVLSRVVIEGPDGYARPRLGEGTVNLEFVSANPTGPLHVGAGRWAVYGDALARLLERCGWRVHREYYLNDRGTQMARFGASVAAAAAGRPVPEDGYRGTYVADWAAEMPEGADPLTWARDRAVADAREVLDRLGVRFDTWFSERSMVASGAIEATLADLRDRGVVAEAAGAVWLRGGEVGLDKDEVLVRRDGEPTYLLGDIAYHREKLTRGDHLVDVWGADHHGHVARLRAGVVALGHRPEDLEVLLGQLVTLQRGGEEVRLGKRSGEVVTLRELLDEVGPDVARLIFLLQSIDTRQTFDLDVVRARSAENPVFYVQYAHARIAAIGRVAAERGIARGPLEGTDLAVLTHERELALLRLLSTLPAVVAEATEVRAPHKVATWARELAGAFHGFYHDCRVMGEGVEAERTQARLWLVEAVRVGLAIGMDLLGVQAPEAM